MTRSLRRSARRVAVALFAAFVLVAAALWFFQERLIFVPPPTPARQGEGAARLPYEAADGQPLFGFYLGAPTNAAEDLDRLIVVFHGNGDLADSWVDWARDVVERTGWPVFLAEYRGYGGLPGRATYDGVMRDARAALALVQSRFGLQSGDLVLYGHSLGSGVATQIAMATQVRSILLESPITSIVDVGRRTLGPPLSWVLPLLSRVDFAPVERVRDIPVPVSVVCGDRDEVSPPWMGRRVFDAALQQGEFLLVTGAGHGDVSYRGGEAYWDWLRRALATGS